MAEGALRTRSLKDFISSMASRIILAAAAFLLLANGLFPPYQATYLASGDNLHAFVGYYVFFEPPSKREACKPFNEVVGCYDGWRRVYPSIDWHRFLVQFLSIVSISGALAVAFRPRTAAKLHT